MRANLTDNQHAALYFEFMKRSTNGTASRQIMEELLHCLDLCFFNSIQALQQRMECRFIEELVNALQTSFEALELTKLEKTFMTLHRAMKAIIECKGDNTFKIPRSKKTEEEMAAFEVMNARIEEEDGMDLVAIMFSGLTF
ncbi:hypothetical protein AC1031_011604 [Aphanomyces cochlioides]|nr:hypothetical protein AC1031_011604 [Aphanomyces cochlioides]